MLGRLKLLSRDSTHADIQKSWHYTSLADQHFSGLSNEVANVHLCHLLSGAA